MRPVDKGEAPDIRIDDYNDAKPYLETRIGEYCSYCEMRVNNCLAVEHKESKNSGGALNDWNNFLLGCTYCNSRKLEKIKKGELEKWLWPDQHNTFLAFTYKNAVPTLNEVFLKTEGEDVYNKAKQIFDDLKLDNRPLKPGSAGKKDKDKRWECRFGALGYAEDAKKTYEKQKTQEGRDDQIKNIIAQAKLSGFFSVWMMVFDDCSEVKKALIDAYPGTAKDCFDENGVAVNRPGEIL